MEALARSFNSTLKPQNKYFGRVGEAVIGAQKVWLLIPETFMNRSGNSVGAFAGFYKIAPENILVAYDELDLPPGVAKLKFGGGHGGHNGIRDCIRSLANSRDFYRLRIGIGHPGEASLVTNYVLGRPATDDKIAIKKITDDALAVMPAACKGEWNDAMKTLHTS